MSQGVNQVILTARITERKSLRYTPAGLPVSDMLLEHEGLQGAGSASRLIQVRVQAKAMGTIAEQIQQMELGLICRFEGFLTQARQGKGLIFEIIRFELN